MGIMQAELQEKRQWVSTERFVEGLSLVNMLPGATAAAVAARASPLGVAGIVRLAGGVGLWLFHSRKLGVTGLVSLAACLAVVHLVARWPPVPGVVAAPGDATGASLLQVGAFLLQVGALTFGGGLTMIAFLPEPVG